jgi:hypothetical protein
MNTRVQVRLVAALLLYGILHMAVVAADPPSAKAPEIRRLLWLCPQQIRWQPSIGPVWYSLGHGNRILSIVPHGILDQGGKAVTSTDGTGIPFEVTLSVHEVLSFDPTTALPARTKLLCSQTIAASDPVRPRKERWGFPTEQGYDWEMGTIPKRSQQSLFRFFLHDQPRFWLTLLVHGEGDLQELPAPLAATAGCEKAYSAFDLHVLVMELLNAPEISMTSTYIEADDPPSNAWFDEEPVQSPWSSGKAKLSPTIGTVIEGDEPRFVALSEKARAEIRRIEALPKIETPGITDSVPVELEGDLN